MQELTIVDIAKMANVSVSTVSRVLNNHPDVSVKTSNKVMDIIRKNEYVPNNSARNLKRESMKAIAVIVKGFTNPVFTTMLKVVQKQLEKNNYTMLLTPVEIDQDEISAAISISKEKKPRGIIFMGGNFTHAQDKLSLLKVPFVMLTITMSDVDPTIFSSVTVNDFQAGYDTAKHIVENGHKNFAIISSHENDISIARLRVNGFKKLLEEKNIPLSNLQTEYSGDFTYQAGYNSAIKLLKQPNFSCLFCISDILAIGALRALHDSGYRVPDDISVIGFDGIEEGKFSLPALSTMKQPFTKMANESIRILLEKIRSGQPHKHTLFDTVFVEGESFKSIL